MQFKEIEPFYSPDCVSDLRIYYIFINDRFYLRLEFYDPLHRCFWYQDEWVPEGMGDITTWSDSLSPAQLETAFCEVVSDLAIGIEDHFTGRC